MITKTSVAAALCAAVSLCALPATAGGPAAVTEEAAPASAPADRPVADWTGFWAGTAVGIGFSTSDLGGSITSDQAPGQGIWLDLPAFGGNGGHIALQFGYNHQMANGLVWGLELDHRSTDVTTTAGLDVALDNAALGLGVEYKPKTMTTLSGRLGWQAAQDVLLYGLVGATRTKFEGKTRAAFQGGATGSVFELSVPGLTLGLGVETMLSDRISLKVDYRRTYLNDYNLIDTPFEGGNLRADLESNLDSFNVGLALRF